MAGSEFKQSINVKQPRENDSGISFASLVERVDHLTNLLGSACIQFPLIRQFRRIVNLDNQIIS